MPTQRPMIIGHHLIWTLYGHWLPNDPRGSGSTELRQEKLASLGPIHTGRKPAHLQPKRSELRSTHKEAQPLLKSPTFWIDDAKRHAIADAFAKVVGSQGYTVWSCAILSNHAHMVVRKHRDEANTIWRRFADASRSQLHALPDIAETHPIWSTRPYKVFLRTPSEVQSRISYVEQNPEKEGLPSQTFDFVRLYDNWPFHKRHLPRRPR